MVPGIYQPDSQETPSTTELHIDTSWKTPAIVSKESVCSAAAEPTSRPAQHIPLPPAEGAVETSQPVRANTPETATLKHHTNTRPCSDQAVSGSRPLGRTCRQECFGCFTMTSGVKEKNTDGL
ncbi:hypothetical protein KUCAC02_037915 [Chaenocephalus aceratus]|nr:hypothetical protein KUCAC02_037915 [Chaenocephalus aceratus]